MTLSGSGIGHGQAVYTTSSSDAGQTWSKNTRVNSVTIDRTKGTWNGQYFFVIPPTVAAGPDYTLTAWSDTRNGDANNQYQDIYTGLITYGAPAGAPSQSDNTALVAAVCAVGGALIGAGAALLAVGLVARRRARPGVPAAR